LEPITPIQLPPNLIAAAKRRRFQGDGGVLLMIDAGYLIQREVARAFRALGWKIVPVPVKPEAEYIERLLTAVIAAKPDLFFTVNHLGFDASGAVASILEQVELPAASWFVDSPAYILLNSPGAVSDVIVTPVWERTELAVLKGAGFKHFFHLPLATDPLLMSVGTECASDDRVGFVGDSMVEASGRWASKLPANKNNALWLDRAVGRMLDGRQNSPLDPDLPVAWETRDRLNFASAVVLEATRRYRRNALGGLEGNSLTVWGDDGWEGNLPSGAIRRPKLDYYLELPEVYRRTGVNLNFTSFQMPTAVNQRAFDVPAAGGFLLADDQSDLHELFSDAELATFSDPDDLPKKALYYKEKRSERERISRKARERILAEHTYFHRVKEIVRQVKRAFGA